MALSTTFTQCVSVTTQFGKITQNNSHFAVQGHSRSPILVPIESSYTTSYRWKISRKSAMSQNANLFRSFICNFLTYLLSCTVSEIHHSKCKKSLYLATPFAFKPPTEGFPWAWHWDDFRKIFRGWLMYQSTKRRKVLPKISAGWVGRRNVTDRQMTDRRTESRNGDSM